MGAGDGGADSRLTCGSCSLPFALCSEAKQLSCGHTLCEVCCKGLLQAARRRSVACPFCREETRVPRTGVEDIDTVVDVQSEVLQRATEAATSMATKAWVSTRTSIDKEHHKLLDGGTPADLYQCAVQLHGQLTKEQAATKTEEQLAWLLLLLTDVHAKYGDAMPDDAKGGLFQVLLDLQYHNSTLVYGLAWNLLTKHYASRLRCEVACG